MAELETLCHRRQDSTAQHHYEPAGQQPFIFIGGLRCLSVASPHQGTRGAAGNLPCPRGRRHTSYGTHGRYHHRPTPTVQPSNDRRRWCPPPRGEGHHCCRQLIGRRVSGRRFQLTSHRPRRGTHRGGTAE